MSFELDAGELEVHVRGVDHLADAWVAVQCIETNDVATHFDPLRVRKERCEDGVARFRDLPRGVLLVGVHVGSDPPHRAVWANSRVCGTRLDFELGGASILGWVRDVDGAPARGARVRITGRHGTVVAYCAPDGSYRAGGCFPAGRYTVEVEEHAITASLPGRTVDLLAGSTRDVSFGPGSDLARWTGRLLAPDGLLVTEADGLPSRAVQLVARSGRGAAVDVRVVEGRVDQWFERGVYALRSGSGEDARGHPAWTVGDRTAPSDTPRRIDLSFDLGRDVQLEGFVLTGRVEPLRAAATSISLGAASASRETQAAILPDGSFRFVGLAPGAHELRWAEDRQESVTIDLHGPIAVEVDLTGPQARPR